MNYTPISMSTIPNTTVQTYTLNVKPNTEGLVNTYLVYIHGISKNSSNVLQKVVVKPLNLSDIDTFNRANEINKKLVASIAFTGNGIHFTIKNDIYKNRFNDKLVFLAIEQNGESISIGNISSVTYADEQLYATLRKYHADFTILGVDELEKRCFRQVEKNITTVKSETQQLIENSNEKE